VIESRVSEEKIGFLKTSDGSFYPSFIVMLYEMMTRKLLVPFAHAP
jgi:hypothetical protein